MDDNKPVEDKKVIGRRILNTSLWFAGIFAFGLLFKLLLNLSDDGKNPQRADKLIIEAVAFCDKDDYKQAIENLDRAIRLDSTNNYAYIYRGKAYFMLGDMDKALKDFDIAIGKKQNAFEAYLYRADLYYKKEDYSNAFNDYSKSIEVGENFDAYVGCGNIYLKMSKPAEAINNYTKAIDLKPNYAEAYFIRGNAHNQQGAYNDAINDFEQAVKLSPNELKYKQSLDFAIKLNTN